MSAMSLQVKLQVSIGSEKVTLNFPVKETVGLICPFARLIVGIGGFASIVCVHKCEKVLVGYEFHSIAGSNELFPVLSPVSIMALRTKVRSRVVTLPDVRAVHGSNPICQKIST